MHTTTTTMNPNLNTQPGVTGSPAVAVEAAKPLTGSEKKSVLARISSVSSGIFGKIKRVMPFVNSAEVAAPAPAANTYAPQTTAPKYVPTVTQTPAINNLPNYKPVTPAEIAPKSTMVYQPPRAIPRRGVVAGVAAQAQRSAPDLSKDLFAHLSAKPVSAENARTARTLTMNGMTSARLSVYPPNSAPRARVMPRTASPVDYNFEYKDPVEQSCINCPAPNLSNVFNRSAVLPARPAVKPAEAATIQPKRQPMNALEDVNNYVAEQDRQYYADLSAQRSRGLVKNLSLWATRIKEDVISAVAPNYVMKKAYEAAQAPSVTPVAQPAVVYNPALVQAKPSLFSRLKAGYENAKAALFPKAGKLVTAAALAGAAMGLSASEQSSVQSVSAQKTAVAYAAKTASKTEAKSLYSSRVSTPANPAPTATPKAVYRAKPAPMAYSKTIPAVNAPSLNSTSPDSTASTTESINNSYLPNIGFQNGIYRGYQGPSDGSAPVSRTSLCSR